MKKKFYRVIGLLTLVLLANLLPELVKEEIVNWLKKAFPGDSYYYLVGILGFSSVLIFLVWGEGSKIVKNASNLEVADSDFNKTKEDLLTTYQNRIDNKLASRFPINIKLKYSTEGTGIKANIYDNNTIRFINIKDELVTLFDRHNGRLLITGEAGSGKTTLLIQLALKLIEREEKQIPIIIDIATWRPRFETVSDWLKELLPQIGFSKKLSKRLITDNSLLPLFDGLVVCPPINRTFEQFGLNNRLSLQYLCISEMRPTVDSHTEGCVR